MKYIKLTKGKRTMVDDEDYQILSKLKWHSSVDRNTVYAKNTHKGRIIPMQNVIMWCPKGYEIDHINRNGLDNRKSNLRIVTRHQNQLNKGPYKSRKYKGIYWREDRNKWYASIRLNGKSNHLGAFSSPIEAAKAYDSQVKSGYKNFNN